MAGIERLNDYPESLEIELQKFKEYKKKLDEYIEVCNNSYKNLVNLKIFAETKKTFLSHIKNVFDTLHTASSSLSRRMIEFNVQSGNLKKELEEFRKQSGDIENEELLKKFQTLKNEVVNTIPKEDIPEPKILTASNVYVKGTLDSLLNFIKFTIKYLPAMIKFAKDNKDIIKFIKDSIL